jgi:maltooligosyltrehalose trehalohydrolase
MSGFAHALPFGAELLAPGRTRFRLWAPAAAGVELLLADGRELPLQRSDDGFHDIEADCAAGTGYRYRIDGGLEVPDPASRAQADDVHGDSLVVDPRAYRWQHPGWRGRPWHELVVYELHVGCCGGFAGVARLLPRLAALGVGAVELMPVADFPGRRNWGYDGVLPFAPERSYGSPDALKALVDRAHGLGLCIYLDVVYNHFGPDGNYLHAYAPAFFDPAARTPWGAAIDFSRAEVREFFLANALYWLLEYRFDGLRLDAVHAIGDPDFAAQLAARVRSAIEPGRDVQLVVEDHRNRAGPLVRGIDAQWNDDAHNALHALLTGERDGYYAAFWPRPRDHLLRCLAEGFAWQGEPAADGRPRGEPSAQLPPTAFVLFLQNHDQVGNRAFGERLAALVDDDTLRAAVVLQLLCPQVPLLFMGEESGLRQPFRYFTDFADALGRAVRDGRRAEFAGFAGFADPARRAGIPDPNDEATFLASIPDFDADDERAHGWRRFYRDLLRLRRERLVPQLPGCRSEAAEGYGEAGLQAHWRLGDGSRWSIAANFGATTLESAPCGGELLVESATGAGKTARLGRLLARSCAVFWQPASGRGPA